MPHTRRSNYKAKLEEALQRVAGKETFYDDTALRAATNTTNVVVNTSIESRALHDLLITVASQAKSLAEAMDECQNTGPLVAVDVGDEVDEHLSHEPGKVILRRVRDVLAAAESRVFGLSVAFEQLENEYRTLRESVTHLKDKNRILQERNLELYHIGDSPDASEAAAFMKSSQSGSDYKRFGVAYYDRDREEIAEWLTSAISTNQHTVVTAPPGNKMRELQLGKPSPRTTRTERSNSDSEDDLLTGL